VSACTSRCAATLTLALALAACSRAEEPAEVPRAVALPSTSASAQSDFGEADMLDELRDFESSRRAKTDFASFPPSDQAFGPDPYAIRALPSRAAPSGHAGPGGPVTGGYVGILRGRAAVVQLDASLRELHRLPAPGSPSALAVAPDGDVLVAGEGSGLIARYRLDGSGVLVAAAPLDLGEMRAVRDIAFGPEGALYAVDEHDDALLTMRGGRRLHQIVGRGPIRIKRTSHHLIVDCLIDHAVLVFEVDAEGVPRRQEAFRIAHDGPIWGIDALETKGGDVILGLGGVEDLPLDRREGFFAFVDSFVFVYRGAHRLEAFDLSEQGVVVPKALAFDGDGVLRVSGYGGDQMAELRWPKREDGEFAFEARPAIETRPLPPGTNAMVSAVGAAGQDVYSGFVAANPLLDAWIAVDAHGAWRAEVVPDDGAPAGRDDASKLGEALVFTTLVAPYNRAEGPLSRFTCETCHFEGYVDGRTHHTGRGDVRATTKPLYGLFNNKPHFTRALDPDLSSVANNEFKVAGAHSGCDPFFAVDVSEFSWMEALRLSGNSFSPLELRRALMTFLMEMSPRPNAAAVRGPFTRLEREGARAFRDICEGCHAARLVADDPGTRVPFGAWESLVTNGPIVWASAEYRKTGILPYVHERGARTTSLRRLYKKRPYFTNGSSPTLADVLSRARITGHGEFLHDRAGADGAELRSLDEATRRALLVFLDRL
jgi:hypothetical protein